MASTPVVLHPLHGPGLDSALAELAGVELVTPADDDGVAAALETTPVLVTYRWDERFLVPGLRWVQAISAGVDQFPLPRLEAAGVALTSARGAHTPAVAEHAVALLLALVRGLGPAMRRAVEHRWEPGTATELGGRTATVLGLGSIGGGVADRLEALGVEVIGVRRRPGTDDGRRTVVAPGRLGWACERSEVLVCALPATPATTGMVGVAELEALGAGWLVNVGRGEAVDESALVSALTTGELRGAGLDVTAVEPLPAASPLWDLEQVIVTPHMAWASDRLPARLAAVFERNLAAYREEEPWATRVV